MTKVRFEIKSRNENATIYARFQNGRKNSFVKKTFLFVKNPDFWLKDKECIKDSIYAPDHKIINPKLYELKGYILNAYIEDVSKGIPINNDWLTRVILKQSGQEDNIEASKVYFLDYCKKWLEVNGGSRVNSRTKSETKKVSIKQYESAINCITEYETVIRKGGKLTFQQIDLVWLKGWVNYMVEWKDYGWVTKNLYLSKLKTLLTEARNEFYIKVNPQFESKKFIIPQSEEEKYMEDLLGVYLNINQIETLFNAELPEDLKPVRDLLVISCWTGVRREDLYKLTAEQLKANRFMIETGKTRKNVTIPVHKHIHAILERNGNKIPYKFCTKTYNEKIKLVCNEVGFTHKVEGVKPCPYTDKVTGRKETRSKLGFYPFYELVTTHIGRKSLGTNLQDILPIEVAMDIQGWSERKTAEYYDKAKREVSADKAQEYFDKMYEIFGEKAEIEVADIV